MNYLQQYCFADETVIAAWDSRPVRDAFADTPDGRWASRTADWFPRFAACYAELRALPRGARRALQRRLARSREFSAVVQSRLGRALPPKLASSLAGAALLLALAQGAHAATINVTTNVPDINDGDGQCSLIEAIVNANNDASTHPDCAAGSGADIIVLPAASTHTISNFYPSPPTLKGLPDITSQITIQGNGATIDGHGSFVTFPVASTGDLTLRDLTVTSGRIGATNSGALTVENSSITDNGNTSIYFNGFFINGGGIDNTGALNIVQSVISGNFSNGSRNVVARGGGVRNNGGTVEINASTIAQNRAERGGGIANYGAMTMQNSTVSGNTASSSRLTGIAGGAGIVNGNSLAIANSTISGNTATATGYYGAAVGGGLSSGGDLIIENSTLSGNTATATGAKGAAAGGGLHTGNSQNSVGLSRALVSGNSATKGPEIYFSGSTNISADDFNLFGRSRAAGVYGFTPGPTDIVSKDPLTKILAPLADNGGPTDTHALVKGSPAIDTAPVDADCPATDQRGIARPQGRGCDIGAFEFDVKKEK